jgi:hypothetical protein
VEIKVIVRHLLGRSKPHAISMIASKGRMTKGILQSSNELIGTWRAWIILRMEMYFKI